MQYYLTHLGSCKKPCTHLQQLCHRLYQQLTLFVLICAEEGYISSVATIMREVGNVTDTIHIRLK